DGIRDFHVTGVQTCALPIFAVDGSELVLSSRRRHWRGGGGLVISVPQGVDEAIVGVDARLEREKFVGAWIRAVKLLDGGVWLIEIGRASCRERGERRGGARS